MKALSVATQQHVDLDTTTLCWRLKITRIDGYVLALVSHDRNLTIDGVPHTCTPGFDVSSVKSTSGLAVGNNELRILADNGYIDNLDIMAGLWDGASYQLDQINWQAPDDGKIVFPYGHLGHATPQYGSFVIELHDFRQALQQDITAIFQNTCRYRLGVRDLVSHCPVIIESFTVLGEVSSFTSRSTFVDVSRVEAEDTFGYGTLTWLSGLNIGVKAKIRSYIGQQFVLETAMIRAITVGDTYSATWGCRGRPYEDCRDKFNSLLDFGGEPDKPGTDAIIAPARESPLGLPSPAPAPSPAPSPAPAPAPAPTPAPAPGSAPDTQMAVDGIVRQGGISFWYGFTNVAGTGTVTVWRQRTPTGTPIQTITNPPVGVFQSVGAIPIEGAAFYISRSGMTIDCRVDD